MERTNLAGRAGRWSAAHWKTAFFGWLVFVSRGRLHRHGRRDQQAARLQRGRRRVRPRSEDPRERRVQAAGVGAGPDPEQQALSDRRPGPSGAQSRTSCPGCREESPEVTPHRLAAGHLRSSARADLEGPALGGRPLRHQGQGRGRGTSTFRGRSTRRPRPSGPTRPSYVEEVGDCERSEGARTRRWASDFEARGEARPPCHADDPAVRLRSARRGDRAGAPRLLGRPRRDRPLGPGQPTVAASGATQTVILLVGWRSAWTTRSSTSSASERSAPQDSIAHRAAATRRSTSGQAVLVSGATVFVVVAGMLVAGDPTFGSIGLGTMIVVAVAIIGSLIGAARADAPARRQHREGTDPVPPPGSRGCELACLERDPRPVLRHPALSVVLSAGFLVVLAIPAFNLSTSSSITRPTTPRSRS